MSIDLEASWLEQLRDQFSQDYMQDTLVRNKDLAKLVVHLFETRFDPSSGESAEQLAESIRAAIADGLDDVRRLNGGAGLWRWSYKRPVLRRSMTSSIRLIWVASRLALVTQ